MTNLRLRTLYKELLRYRNALSTRNGFVRNSFTLTVGTAFSQGIPVILSPILARLFTPEEFGIYAIVTSITVIISVLSTGKYETVIVIAKDKKDAVNLVSLSMFISLLVSVFAFILFLFFSDFMANALHQPRLGHWILLCPLLSLLISVYLCYNEWCIRNSQFVILAFNKVINSSSISVSNVLFGLAKITSGGLIFGELAGRSVTALTCIFHMLRKELNEFKTVSFSHMKKMAKKYIDCPRFILPGQFLNTFGGQVVVLLIAAFFGNKEVGYYSMTVLVIYVPSSIISTAVRDVFKQRATIEYSLKNNCIDIFKKLTLTITVFSFFIIGILFLILPELFSFAFGENWRVAGEYARILCPMVFISFISESVFGVFIVAEKLKAVLYWQATYFIVNVASLIAGYYIFKNIKMALLCFMVGKSMVHLLSLYMSYVFAKGDNAN